MAVSSPLSPAPGNGALRIAADFIVPLPSPDEAVDDPQVLVAWYDALVNLVATEIPHDLLALWAYPPHSEPVLIGPEALAEDDVRIPLPSPRIARPPLDLLEEMVEDAGYASAVALPVRYGRFDVGLLLVASFPPFSDPALARARLNVVAHRLGSGVARIADPAGEVYCAANPAEVLARIAGAGSSAAPPVQYARVLSAALNAVLPHDRLDLLVPGASPEQHYVMSRHGEGSLWSDPTLIVGREILDPPALVSGLSVIVPDARVEARLSAWRSGESEVRSVIGARLITGERLTGYLLLSHSAPGVYDATDAELLMRAAPMVAARVEAQVQAHQLRVLRSQLGSSNAIPNQLRRMATVLASRGNFADALYECVAEATALLPFHRVRFAVRAGAEDDARVAIVIPGEQRAFADLPLVPVRDQLLEKVIAGEVPHGVSGGQMDIELVFPLRVSGVVIGAMLLTTSTPDAFTRSHLALAQQVADSIAPWLELERRAVGAMGGKGAMGR